MSPDTSPLEQLAQLTGRDLPHLFQAREKTRQVLEERSNRLSQLEHDPDVSVVLMGSWGRREVTSRSDDDFMVLVAGSPREEVRPSLEEVRGVLDRPPSPRGVFGEPVFSEGLVENIGLEEDSNNNLTRRMLFLLESVPATGSESHAGTRKQLLERYLDESIKEFRPPRFLLNDVIRYWRTICVDFAGKEHEGPEKWGIRNAKLRTSRKILFAGGLLPVFACARLVRGEMSGYLDAQLDQPPTDRIAEAFLDHGAPDAGERALGAYDEFLGLLDDEPWRLELESVTRESASGSDAFAQAARIGKELESGLLALLFETDDLPKLVRDYAIF